MAKEDKPKIIQVGNRNMIYTHIFVPNEVNVEISFLQMLKILIGFKFNIELNIYMNEGKVVTVKGKTNLRWK